MRSVPRMVENLVEFGCDTVDFEAVFGVSGRAGSNEILRLNFGWKILLDPTFLDVPKSIV